MPHHHQHGTTRHDTTRHDTTQSTYLASSVRGVLELGVDVEPVSLRQQVVQDAVVDRARVEVSRRRGRKTFLKLLFGQLQDLVSLRKKLLL